MASKETKPKKKPRGCKTRAELEELLAKAQAEVKGLLKHHQAGTLSQVDLKARLKEIKNHLRLMDPFDWYTKH